MTKPLISASYALAKVAFVICAIGLFPAFIIWAICDGHGFLPYAMAALTLTSLFARKTAQSALQSQSSKVALLAWLPLILNSLLIFVVSGEISSCH